MKEKLPTALFFFTVSLALLSCKETTEPSQLVQGFGPPQNVKAVSLNETSVRLEWAPAPGVSDSSFGDYVVAWDANIIFVPKSGTGYEAAGLGSGLKTFLLYSRKTDGTPSQITSISWATATRFDTTFTLTEYTQLDVNRISGLHLGAQSTNPYTIAVNSSANPFLDAYLFGGDGVSQQPLSLYSADQFAGTFEVTDFSTVSSSYPSLDLALSAYPGDSTFVRRRVQLQDNTIYYALFTGESNQTLTARIHVHIVPGLLFPNRAIQVQISLQRVPGLRFAQCDASTGDFSIAQLLFERQG